MKKGENLKRKNLPTMQQLSYLMELYHLQAERGVVDKVAKACGVSHSSVSRYFKSCVKNGLLTEKYQFTGMGRIRMEGYREIMTGLREYFTAMGIPPEEVEDNVRNQVEHVEFHVLASMVKNMRQQAKGDGVQKVERCRGGLPLELFEKGDWEVYFLILHLQEQRQTGVSMADRGFKKPARLHLSEDEGWLELTVCEMTARSRVNGQLMRGHLDSLKYACDGILYQADIRDGKVRIPLSACRFQRRKGGEMKGMVAVTATCDVGRTHMPESTAVLIFWL